jgi:hypothetical protein
MRQEEAVLRANLDADVASFAPFIDPPDVDEVDDRGGEVRSLFGGVHGSNGRISTTRTAVRGSAAM